MDPEKKKKRLTWAKLPDERQKIEQIATRPEVAQLIARINAEFVGGKADKDAIKARNFKIGEILLEAKEGRKLNDIEFQVICEKTEVGSPGQASNYMNLAERPWLREPEIYDALPSAARTLFKIKAMDEEVVREAVRRKLITPKTILDNLDRIQRIIQPDDPDEEITLRASWHYFGGKTRDAYLYPEPRYDTIIEPFAGAAGYSMCHHKREVFLYDKDPDIAGIWKYLIRANPDEIRDTKIDIEAITELDASTPLPLQNLIGRYLRPTSATAGVTISPRAKAKGGWDLWSREKVASQLEHLRHWEAFEGDYWDAPDIEATFFIDPPYWSAGDSYKFGSKDIDYAKLAEWCRSRKGQVIVCEGMYEEVKGSGDWKMPDWLPFKPFHSIRSAGLNKAAGGVSHEVIWLNDEEAMKADVIQPREDQSQLSFVLSPLRGKIADEIYRRMRAMRDELDFDFVTQEVVLAEVNGERRFIQLDRDYDGRVVAAGLSDPLEDEGEDEEKTESAER